MTRQLKDLTGAQLKDAYYTVYREAFPPQELKPLSSMRRMTRDGVYRNLALFEGGGPVAFANLWLDGDHILIDYLCVPAARRNCGLGAELLTRLRELYPPETVFIVETEAPTGDPEADELINRRLVAPANRRGGNTKAPRRALPKAPRPRALRRRHKDPLPPGR